MADTKWIPAYIYFKHVQTALKFTLLVSLVFHLNKKKIQTKPIYTDEPYGSSF